MCARECVFMCDTMTINQRNTKLSLVFYIWIWSIFCIQRVEMVVVNTCRGSEKICNGWKCREKHIYCVLCMRIYRFFSIRVLYTNESFSLFRWSYLIPQTNVKVHTKIYTLVLYGSFCRLFSNNFWFFK